MHILNKTPKNRLLTLTAENVLKVMNGRKTQTRRVISPQPPPEANTVFRAGDGSGEFKFLHKMGGIRLARTKWVKCPYGRPGDTLSVAEGYQIEGYRDWPPAITGRYLADGAKFDVVLTSDEWTKVLARKRPYASTPGRFMYKSLARTQLLLVDVRAERLQDITQGDVLAEGIQMPDDAMTRRFDPVQPVAGHPELMRDWIALWDSINGRDGRRWADNPWVWVIQFARIIDWADTACQGRTYKLDMGNGGRDTYHVCPHASCDPTVVVDERPWSYAGPDQPAV